MKFLPCHGSAIGPLIVAAASFLSPALGATPGWNNFEAADVVVGPASLPSPSSFYYPSAVLVDPASGKVFVSDSSNNRVLRFSSEATLKSGLPAEAVLGQPDLYSAIPGLGDSRLYGPNGLALDGAGGIWVADESNYRLIRFANAATLTNGAPAVQVLGQPDFQSRIARINAVGVDRPTSAATDSQGRLWVVDYFNHRILRFDHAITKGNGAAADGVLGQPNFVSKAYSTSAQTFSDPHDVAVDAQDRLWVADFGNHRVLRFDAPASGNFLAADGVLGQEDFNSSLTGAGPNQLSRPIRLAASAGGQLYVNDAGAQRVVRWDQAATKTNGAPADGVLGRTSLAEDADYSDTAGSFSVMQGIWADHLGRLLVTDAGRERILIWTEAAKQPFGAPANVVVGQPDPGTVRLFNPAAGVIYPRLGLEDPLTGKFFIADQGRVLRFASRTALEAGQFPEAYLGQEKPDQVRASPVSRTLMQGAWGLALDADGQLWVSDSDAHRVVSFAQAATAPTGAKMTIVLGQPTFADSTPALTRGGMNKPRGIALDSAGNLYVADSGNHRVLRFLKSALSTSGSDADAVIGEPDFVTTAALNLPARLATPSGLAFDPQGRLWVADTDRDRVVRYDAPLTTSGLAAPAAVLGGLAVVTPTGMNDPMSLVVLNEALWVVDRFNRALRFDHAGTLSTGAKANGVLGAETLDYRFDSQRSRRGFYQAEGIFADAHGSLWISDINNHRLMRFTPDTPVISSTAITAEGHLVLSYEVEAGVDYEVQASTDFSTWHTVATTHALSAGHLEFTETQPASGQFYRVLEH